MIGLSICYGPYEDIVWGALCGYLTECSLPHGRLNYQHAPNLKILPMPAILLQSNLKYFYLDKNCKNYTSFTPTGTFGISLISDLTSSKLGSHGSETQSLLRSEPNDSEL